MSDPNSPRLSASGIASVLFLLAAVIALGYGTVMLIR